MWDTARKTENKIVGIANGSNIFLFAKFGLLLTTKNKI